MFWSKIYKSVQIWSYFTSTATTFVLKSPRLRGTKHPDTRERTLTVRKLGFLLEKEEKSLFSENQTALYKSNTLKRHCVEWKSLIFKIDGQNY